MTHPAITIDRLTKRFGQTVAVDDLDLEVHPGGGRRLPRTQRRRQDHHHPPAARLPAPNGRPLPGPWRGAGTPGRPAPAGRLPARRPQGRPGDHRQSALRLVRPATRRAGPATRRGVGRPARPRPDQAVWCPVEGQPPKDRAGAGVPARPGCAPARRATSGLDPLVQQEFLRLLTEAAHRGAAVLFSSHVLPEVERAASRVAIIRRGRLVATATVDELLDRARHRLELRYASPPPPGFLEGVPGVTDREIDGRTAVIAVDGPVGPALHAATEQPGLLRVRNAGDDLEDLFVSLYSPQPAEVG